MNTSESSFTTVCSTCGESFCRHNSVNFAPHARDVMCAPCALARGGEYDADHGCWTTPPVVYRPAGDALAL